jgi:hypothetical protein
LKEIKIRVWDGKMLHYPETNYAYQLHWSRAGGWSLFWVWKDEDRLIVDSSVGQAAFELFTGFTDKNNKEIYEGDILQQVHGTTKKPFSQKVKWCEQEGWFGVSFLDGAYIGTLRDLLKSKMGHTVEVIGNIHGAEPAQLGGWDGQVNNDPEGLTFNKK